MGPTDWWISDFYWSYTIWILFGIFLEATFASEKLDLSVLTYFFSSYISQTNFFFEASLIIFSCEIFGDSLSKLLFGCFNRFLTHLRHFSSKSLEAHSFKRHTEREFWFRIALATIFERICFQHSFDICCWNYPRTIISRKATR